MKKIIIFILLLLFSITLLSCNNNLKEEYLGEKVLKNDPKESIEPFVYVTYGGHIEDSPRFWKDCSYYGDVRKKLLDVAELVDNYGVTFNLQIEYDFLKGVINCENDDMKKYTAGENIIHYLASHHNLEIDAHQEGAWDWEPDSVDNWADIHYLGLQVTPLMSDVTGLVWDYPNQFIELNEGQIGRIHPDYVWKPMIIGSAVGYKHHLGDFSDDDVSSGVWKPKGTDENFFIHDETMRMVYTGSGVHGNWGGKPNFFETPIDYIEVLQKYQLEGIIDPNLMWTSNIYIPQKIMFNNLEKFEDLLLEGQRLNNVEYVTYSNLVKIWFDNYGAQPSQFLFEEIDKSDYTV